MSNLTSSESEKITKESRISVSTSPIEMENISPLDEAVPALIINEETTTMHFLCKSKLGWIAWREKEASLFSLFERAFSASRCELKFGESMDEFGLEIEIPNNQKK
ncbi:hypothetical protein HDU92_000187 [Lobulomyces angularis]|nr:hypothetical protein HDU92_000187 [Lobulomyces angularis]